jgi:TRAP-type C4-dicarboxylate transport system permease small subunit
MKNSNRKRIFCFLQKITKPVLDFLELYLPIAAFLSLFILFLLQVFFRYFLNRPLTWPQELTSMLFVWTTLFGAAYVLRKGEHIVFNLIYDRLGTRGKLFTLLLGDALLIAAFCYALQPSWEYVLVDCRSFIRTPVLRICYAIVYFPFVICMPLFIIHLCHHFITNLIQAVKKRK